MCFLVPFLEAWQWPFTEIALRHGPGNFAFNLVTAVGLMAAGAMLAGYWWKLSRWLLGKEDSVMSVSAGLLFGLGLMGLNTDWLGVYWLGVYYPYLVGGLLVLSITYAFGRRRVRSADWMGLNDVLRWLDKKNHVNIVFFFVLLASLLINNLTLIVGMDASGGEKLSIFIGRFLTHLFFLQSYFPSLQ